MPSVAADSVLSTAFDEDDFPLGSIIWLELESILSASSANLPSSSSSPPSSSSSISMVVGKREIEEERVKEKQREKAGRAENDDRDKTADANSNGGGPYRPRLNSAGTTGNNGYNGNTVKIAPVKPLQVRLRPLHPDLNRTQISNGRKDPRVKTGNFNTDPTDKEEFTLVSGFQQRY